MIISIIFHIIIILILLKFGLKIPENNIESFQYLNVNIVFSENLESNLKIEGKNIDNKFIPSNQNAQNISEKNKSKSNDNVKKDNKNLENQKITQPSNVENKKLDSQSAETKEEKSESNIIEKEDENKNILAELTNVKSSISSGTESSDVVWDNNVSRKIQLKVVPQVPDRLKKLSGKFTVVVYIEVNKFGSVIFVQVVQSSGIPELDNLCKEAVRKWIFSMISEDRIDSGKITFIFNFN